MASGPPADTSIGGDRHDFPSTIWSTFLNESTADASKGRKALETLSREYWKPVYSYIRAKWSKTNEDAKDRTQDFFLWVMESGFLARVDPTRGRFRSFLKVALNHYLSDLERMSRSIKRGGEHKFLALDGGDDQIPQLEVPDPQGRTPEQLMDEMWRAEVLGRAVDRLGKVLTEEGKRVHFQVFRDYFLSESGEIEYREVAARYGIGTADVSNYLMFVKKRFRVVLSELVSETVNGPGDLDEEMNWLFRKDAKEVKE